MKQPQSITSLPESPDVDLRRRTTRYLIAMGVRVVCILLCFFVQGWWLVLPILGAVILPYVAVVVANAAQNRGGQVLRPGSAALVRQESGPE